MSSDLNQAKSLTELQNLKGYIEKELDLETQLLKSSAEVPIPSLIVSLDPDHQSRGRAASLMFLPLDDAEVEAIKLLQLYIETPIVISAKAYDNILRLLLSINMTVPIGAFSLNTENKLVYKYVYSLGKFKKIDQKEFIETYLLWMFTLDSISALTEEVADGHKELKAAIQELEDE